MKTLFFLPLVLFATCAASLPHPQKDKAVLHIALDDLVLDKASDRAVLRERVTTAVSEFCRAFSDEVTPQLIRTEASYCRDTMRQSVLAEMSREVRRAYARAEKEAR